MSRDIRKKNDPLLKAVMAEWLRRWTGWRDGKHARDWTCFDELKKVCAYIHIYTRRIGKPAGY